MKRFKTLALIVTTMATTLIFAGCTNSEVSDKNVEMITVTSVKGEVEIPANPQRIVDISGSTEELLILGYTPVATGNVDSYETDKVPTYIADELKETKIVGNAMMETMDIEAIIASNPDLIIMAERQEKIYDQLKAIAPVVMVKDHVNDWRGKLIETSKLFDKEKDANEWLAKYDEKSEKLGKEIVEKNGEQTYLTVLASTGQFMVFTDAGIGTIVNDDLGLARPSNLPVQDSVTLPVLTMEGLTEINADHIVIIATESDKKDLAASSVWSEIKAVKDGNLTILDATPFFGQSYNPIGKELLLELIKNEVVK